MSEKLTNQEILSQIAELSDEERNEFGVTTDMRDAAARAAAGNTAAKSAFYQSFTPLYNAFVGFIVKFALSQLSKATYDDVYGAHHRNLTQGRPQLGFVKPAKKGTGNSSQQFASAPAIGGLTTVTTAEMPDVVSLYDITVEDYEARIPVSVEDVKTAFNTEYGISDLYTKVREGLEDAIVEDRNASYDDLFESVVDEAIPVGTGSEIAANANKATYALVPGGANWAAAASSGDFSAITDDQLTQVFVAIKRHLFEIMGRPETTHNALAVKNNKKSNLVCYVWAPLYAELSRVKASAFNLDELLDRGVTMTPLNAPWLGMTLTSGYISLAGLGSADFIRDYPTSDFASTVPTDRGVIECRFMTTEFAVAGYEPFTFLVGGSTDTENYPILSVSVADDSVNPGWWTIDEYNFLQASGSIAEADVQTTPEEDIVLSPVGGYLELKKAPAGSYGLKDITVTWSQERGTGELVKTIRKELSSSDRTLYFTADDYSAVRAEFVPSAVNLSVLITAVSES